MARNKYPEETINKIMSIATELFFEKGYENTSMQDIVNRLGMSKGAIYHHFKSKEELLDRITYRLFSGMEWFYEIVNDTSLTGLEQLRRIFFHELGNEEKKKWDTVYRPRLQDPKMLMEQIHCSVKETAPILAKVVEAGNADGTMHARYPREAAELLMLSINVWINPGVFHTDKKQFMDKVHYLKFIMDYSGIPVFNEEILALCESYYESSVAHMQTETV